MNRHVFIAHRLAASWAVLWLATLATPAAAQQTVRCESSNGKYRYCNVPTGNQVSLLRQRSSAACRLGETWGYDSQGVWVQQGCAGDFQVGALAGPTPGGAANPVAGAPATAGRWPWQQQRPALALTPPPRWAVGTFVGEDSTERVKLLLTVAADGQVSGRIGDQPVVGRFSGNRLDAGAHRYSVVHSGTGFLATNERNPAHRIQFNLDAGTN
jgi:hypothetical protein